VHGFLPYGNWGLEPATHDGPQGSAAAALGEPALVPHELDKSLRDCAAQDSAEEVCRFQEKADQFPTPYEGVEVKLRFPISGELRFSRQGGRPWTLPCAPAETMRALVARFSRGLGREIKLLTMPRHTRARCAVLPGHR
jgi:hypothetical protein